jgi:pilus assembly protein Flp/PilA
MITRIRTKLYREEGASAVEYALLVAGIAVVVMLAVFLLGGTVKNVFSKSNTCIAGGAAGAAANC